MSPAKRQKQEIAVTILNLVLIVVWTGFFHWIWTKLYAPRFYVPFYSVGRYAPTVFFAILAVLLGRAYGAFRIDVDRMSQVFYSCVVSATVLALIMYFTAWMLIRSMPGVGPALLALAAWTLTALIWIRPARAVTRHYCPLGRTVVLYGSDRERAKGEQLAQILPWRFKLVGQLPADKTIDEICEFLDVWHAENVIFYGVPEDKRAAVHRWCIDHFITVYVRPDTNDFLMNAAMPAQVETLPVFYSQRLSVSAVTKIVKRTFDIVISLVGLVVLSPLFLRHRVEKIPSHGADRRVFARRLFGDLIRREGTSWKAYVPELINVLKGEMSFIGPSPMAVSMAGDVEAKLPDYALRYQVRPGILGYAQIYGRGAGDAERLQMDLMYVRQFGLATDYKLMMAAAVYLILRRA